MLYENINIPLWKGLQTLRGQHVLDIGCGTGKLGELLHQNGNYVEGITHSNPEAAIAETRLDRVHVLDLNNSGDVTAAIKGKRFDLLLFADVLEHLIDPVTTLRLFLPSLAPHGKVCVSLPNVACFYVRGGLMLGRFNMSETGGILDATHLHFYTRRTAAELLECTGMSIEHTAFVPAFSVWLYQFFKRTNAAAPNDVGRSWLFRFYSRWVYPAETRLTAIWPTLMANQFVFTCRVTADCPGS